MYIYMYIYICMYVGIHHIYIFKIAFNKIVLKLPFLSRVSKARK